MTEAGQGPPEDLAEPAPAGPVEVVAGLSKAYKTWLAGIGFVIVFILILLWGSNRPANPTFADASSSTATTATGPAFGDKKVGVGSSCLHVLVADTPEKRAEGLRHRSSDLGGYDGMTFEYDSTRSTKTLFTMSGVKSPLTIGFYDEAGMRVDATDMAPCPQADSSCPTYGSKANFKTAIETPKGKLPDGPLRACPA